MIPHDWTEQPGITPHLWRCKNCGMITRSARTPDPDAGQYNEVLDEWTSERSQCESQADPELIALRQSNTELKNRIRELEQENRKLSQAVTGWESIEKERYARGAMDLLNVGDMVKLSGTTTGEILRITISHGKRVEYDVAYWDVHRVYRTGKFPSSWVQPLDMLQGG